MKQNTQPTKITHVPSNIMDFTNNTEPGMIKNLSRNFVAV